MHQITPEGLYSGITHGLKLKERRFRLDVRSKFFTDRLVMCWNSCPERCGCPIPGGVQGQAGWGPGQPGLVLNVKVGDPAHGRGLELDDP